MPIILIVEKPGTIKETNVKSLTESEIYKKAGFKSDEGFKCYTTWTANSMEISLYGKTTGRANQENKYEFPPPVDNILFFGNCVLLAKKGSEFVSLSAKDWEQIYETLYGGFEDIGAEDSEEEEEEDLEGIALTKSGYEKDGFVVDDEEDDDEYVDEEEDEGFSEESEEDYKKKKKAAKKPKKTPPKKPKLAFVEKEETETEENYLDCTSELSEDSYV